jgi:hypothetical protein
MANGGIIGPNIVTSFGNCTVTSKTSTGSIALQSKTSLIEYVVVAGGGAGGGGYGGGGGAGGFKTAITSVSCGATLCATVGAGGAASTGSYASGSAGGTGTNSVLSGGGIVNSYF